MSEKTGKSTSKNGAAKNAVAAAGAKRTRSASGTSGMRGASSASDADSSGGARSASSASGAGNASGQSGAGNPGGGAGGAGRALGPSDGTMVVTRAVLGAASDAVSDAASDTVPDTASRDEPSADTWSRVAVRKTYKLYIGGAFPRSESGRSYQVTSAQGAFLANAALASRKDARDAVKAARSAFGGWSGATAYNRGQILYRIAEMLEGRREQFAAEIAAVEGVTRESALAQADAAIDRWVWYAGWSDKLTQVRGTVNPVAGPYWNVSSPEPTGVVAVFAPQRPSLFGLVSVLAPVIVSGNTAVVVAPDSTALPAITLAEVLATSDLPGGVVNVLTGRVAELGKPLAEHLDVDALDLTGVTDLGFATDLERAAAENLKRLRRPEPEADWTADPGLDRIVSFLEIKTVWHPVGV